MSTPGHWWTLWYNVGPHRGWLCCLPMPSGWPAPWPPAAPVVDPRVAMAADLAEAVDAAVSMTGPGGVVLFSPAAPTPDGEGGYGARSRQFVAAAGLGESE